RTYLLENISVDRLRWHCKTFINSRFSMVSEREPEVWHNLKAVAFLIERQVEAELVESEKADGHSAYENELRIKLGDFIRDTNAFDRPYIHLVYANMLWRLSFHEAAWHHMLDFIKSRYSKIRSSTDIVMEIQARYWLIVLVEDRFASKPNLPQSLLEAHLQNIDQTL